MRFLRDSFRLSIFPSTLSCFALALSSCHGVDVETGSDESVFTEATESNDGSDDGSGNGTLDDTNDSSVPAETTFPQAFHKAFWANPELYDRIPIQIRTAGQNVNIEIAGVNYTATPAASDHTFVAEVEIGSLSDGTYPISALVDDETIEDAPTLHIGRAGMQFTNWDQVGSAATPRLHSVDGAVYLTWKDRRSGSGRAWLQELNGAGVGQGEPVGISPGDQDIRLGRAVVTPNHVCLLYQEIVDGASANFRNWLRVTDHQGNEVIEAIPLDEEGAYGLRAGDITFDKEGCVAVWHKRASGLDGKMQIEWVRVHLGTLEVQGPKTIATSGDEDPIGTFLPTTFIHVATLDDRSMVTFTRNLYNDILELSVLTNYATIVDQEGAVLSESVLPTPYQFPFAIETKVSMVHDQWIPLWTASDLLAMANTDCSTDDCNPDIQIFGSKLNGAQDPSLIDPTDIIFDDQNRSQMALIEHPLHFATMAWIDERSREDSIVEGGFELYFAAVDEDLLAGEEHAVPHARFIVDSAELGGQSLGSNVMLVWIDERKGGSNILNPTPEIYFETLWY